MEEKEYIVVGLGIAGICFCEQLEKNNKSFVVIDNGERGATANSGGVLNPTVLKRFTAVWNANKFFPASVAFYNQLSNKVKEEFFIKTPVLRIFKSPEEQNDWCVASDKIELRQFLSTKFLKNTNKFINAPLGFGEVLNTHKISPSFLLEKYREFLVANNFLASEKFQYELLEQSEDKVIYKNISAKYIVFCEGAKALCNPFFPKHKLIGNKGEYIIIKAPKLKLEQLLKGPLYVIPLENGHYKVGATYSRDNCLPDITEEAKEEILAKLQDFIKSPFEVTLQTAGIRPTTKDHRPLLGNLKQNPRLIFFNGLGSRGFLMAPLLSEILLNSLENKTPLPVEMDIRRMLK